MFAVPLILMIAIAFPAQQQVDMRVLVEQALDAPAEIVLQDVKLANLVAVVEKETGVRIVIRPEVMALLPYGNQTVIADAEIRNVPLRDGLRGLVGGLGMTFVINPSGDVEIVPKPALARLARVATWPELETIRRVSGMSPGTSREDLESLRPLIQFRVVAADPWGGLAGRVERIGAGPGDEVLDLACNQLGWTWFPEGTHIVVLTKQAQLDRQLGTVVSLRFARRPLTEILRAIGRASGVPIRIDPGALASVPRDLRDAFSLTVDGYSAAEALEAIAAPTGLGYMLTPDGVLVYDARSDGRSVAGGTAAREDEVIGLTTVTLNGRTFQVILRASDVPPDVRSGLDDARRRAIDTLIRAAQLPRSPPATPAPSSP